MEADAAGGAGVVPDGDPVCRVLRLIERTQGGDTLSESLYAVAELAAWLAGQESAGVFLVDRVTGDLRRVASAGPELGEVGVPRTNQGGPRWLPLAGEDETLGWLVVPENGCPLAEARRESLDLAAAYASRLLRASRLNELLRHRVDDVTAVLRAGQDVSGTLELGEVLHLVLGGVRRLCGAQSCSVMLLDDDGKVLRVRSSLGLPDDVERGAAHRVGEGIAGFVAARGETLFLRDVAEAGAYVRTESGEPWQPRRDRYLAPSCVCIPLKVSGRVVGVLNVNDKEGGDFTAGDVELLQLFANQAALAVGNAIAHRELRRLSVTDGLTRTYLPTYFRKRLGEVAAAARMHESTLAVVMIDLDAFKGVNDRHGHQVGDAVLEGVAAVLRSSVRPHDIVARYGGEEFVVVLVGVTPAIALAITERQRDAIASSRFTDGVADVRITASFGVAMLPYDAEDPRTLVAVADRNLYDSKHVGGNAITFSSAVRGMMAEEGPRSEV